MEISGNNAGIRERCRYQGTMQVSGNSVWQGNTVPSVGSDVATKLNIAVL